jgi:polyhydroxyalkanoate synthesis regulator phasin
MLKDLIYIGLGGALLAKEKVEKELSELVDKGKLNKEEAQSFIDKAKVN